MWEIIIIFSINGIFYFFKNQPFVVTLLVADKLEKVVFISVVGGFIVKSSLGLVPIADETFSDVYDGVVMPSVEVVLNAEEVVSGTKEDKISRI